MLRAFARGPGAWASGEHEGVRGWVVLTLGLWLGEVPVTQALWTAVMEENPSRFKGDDHPVKGGSREDCQRFVKTVNEIVPGLEPPLPREHEWEYACRAGPEGPTWLGIHNAKNPDRIAWYSENSEGWTHPVGGKEANPFGLHDMLGNVWEWCEDHFGPYDHVPVVDPPSFGTGTNRVGRGGSWKSLAWDIRAAKRDAVWPDIRGGYLGLRLAASASR